MKKILYLVSTLKKSGPTNQLSYIIKYLDRNKFEPIVLTLSPEQTNDSMKDYFISELAVPAYSLGLSRAKGAFLGKKYVEQFIKKHGIDLVHSQGIRADNLMSRINDIARVATLRNYPYYDYPMTYGYFIGHVMARTHLSSIKKIDMPIVVSGSISKMLKKRNNYEINFIQNGTDLEKFQNLNKNELRSKLNIDKDKLVFISVGHLSDRKDPITVIKAFQKANIDNSELIFLGDGPLRDKCKSLALSYSNIKFTGRVDNVQEYLGASDYFISASLAEGLPNAVLEAMAGKNPCILSNIPPHIEIYNFNKKASLLFKSGCISDLTNKLIKVSSDKYKLIGGEARKVIEHHLSAKIMSGKYQKIYEELLD